jgi:branched-subunit amino acid aminotransferase/4-amino-4-deoxychorismate lyase
MHKSLNYLFHLAARQAAMDHGADEAVILDASGCVAETAAGSLIFRADGRWWRPESPYQLPGITMEAVCGEMKKAGLEVKRKRIQPQDLFQAETVYVLNSLMLVMPARSVDGHALARPDPGHAALLRERLLTLD